MDYFSESQIMVQNRYGKITMWMLLFFILANAVLKEFIGVYAKPIDEFYIVVLIPVTYYLSVLMFKGAFFTQDKEKNKYIISILGIDFTISVHCFSLAVYSIIKESNYEQLTLSSCIQSGFAVITSFVTILAYFARKFIYKNQNSDENQKQKIQKHP